MARLTVENLALEITYRDAGTDDLNHHTARYEIRFLSNGEPIVRDAVLKRQGSWWSSATPGAFLASDFDADRLLAVLEEALATGEPRYHEPVDPALGLAIYPDQPFGCSLVNPLMRSGSSKVQHSLPHILTGLPCSLEAGPVACFLPYSFLKRARQEAGIHSSCS